MYNGQERSNSSNNSNNVSKRNRNANVNFNDFMTSSMYYNLMIN